MFSTNMKILQKGSYSNICLLKDRKFIFWNLKILLKKQVLKINGSFFEDKWQFFENKWQFFEDKWQLNEDKWQQGSAPSMTIQNCKNPI